MPSGMSWGGYVLLDRQMPRVILSLLSACKSKLTSRLRSQANLYLQVLPGSERQWQLLSDLLVTPLPYSNDLVTFSCLQKAWQRRDCVGTDQYPFRPVQYNLLKAVMMYCAACNGVVLRTLKVVFSTIDDVGCFPTPYTLVRNLSLLVSPGYQQVWKSL